MENKATFATPAIFDKLPNYFWSAFAGELVAVFGIDIFEKDEDGLRQVDYLTGTSGWAAALNTVCHRLDELLKRVGSYDAEKAYYKWLMSGISASDSNMDESFEYKIPGEILAKFTDEFLDIFVGWLIRAFGAEDKRSKITERVWLTGTVGWHGAFAKACDDLNMGDVLEYYKSFEWHDSDIFDNKLYRMLKRRMKL